MVQKGKISDVFDDGKTVTVTPYASSTVTTPLTVPHFLIGVLPVGTPVVYVVFEDGTGIILSRMDGEWNGSFA